MPRTLPDVRAYLGRLLAPEKEAVAEDDELDWQALKAANIPPGASSDFLPDVSSRFLYNASAFVHHLLAAAPGSTGTSAAAYLRSAHDAFLVAITPPNHARHQGVLALFRELKIQLHLARALSDDPADVDFLFSRTLQEEHVVEATPDDQDDWELRIQEDRLKLKATSVEELVSQHPYRSFLHDLLQYVRGLVKEYDAQVARHAIATQQQQSGQLTSVEQSDQVQQAEQRREHIPSSSSDDPLKSLTSNVSNDPTVSALARVLSNVTDDAFDGLGSLEAVLGTSVSAPPISLAAALSPQISISTETQGISSTSPILQSFANEEDVRRAISAIVNSTDLSTFNFDLNAMANPPPKATAQPLSIQTSSFKAPAPSSAALAKRRKLIGKARQQADPNSTLIKRKSQEPKDNASLVGGSRSFSSNEPNQTSTSPFNFNYFEGLTDAIDPILRSFTSQQGLVTGSAKMKDSPISSTHPARAERKRATSSSSLPKRRGSMSSINRSSPPPTLAVRSASEEPRRQDHSPRSQAKRLKRPRRDLTPPAPTPPSSEGSDVNAFKLKDYSPDMTSISKAFSPTDAHYGHDWPDGQTSNLYRQNRSGAGQRIPWTEEEDRTFREELERIYHSGPPDQRVRPWSAIMKRHGPKGQVSTILRNRNNVGLKDRARNLRAAYDKKGEAPPPGLAQCNGYNRAQPRRAGKQKSQQFGDLDV